MAKFKTKIAHKKSQIEVHGLVIALDPDQNGFCEFDVPDERDDVFARLLEIPEGFEQIADAGGDVSDVPDDLIVTMDGEKLDLATLDQKNLFALSKHIGLDLHHKTGEAKLRAAIVEKLAE